MARKKTLKGVTKQLGNRYRMWKKNEKGKDTLKGEFFNLATEEIIKRGSLDTKTVVMKGPTEEDVRTRIPHYYPIFEVVEIKPNNQDGWFSIILRELPEFKPFTYVNVEDEAVYQRIVSSGSINLDEERLAEEDPELYTEVTFQPPTPPRELKPIDELTSQQLAELNDYIYESKPTVKLAPPRKAKPEEIAEASS
jgi:hypothetical protein